MATYHDSFIHLTKQLNLSLTKAFMKKDLTSKDNIEHLQKDIL